MQTLTSQNASISKQVLFKGNSKSRGLSNKPSTLYFSSVQFSSVYYLATISYTLRNNKYIHKISRSAKEGHKKPQGLYEMDLLNPRV